MHVAAAFLEIRGEPEVGDLHGVDRINATLPFGEEFRVRARRPGASDSWF